jgi:hypothetical protein
MPGVLIAQRVAQLRDVSTAQDRTNIQVTSYKGRAMQQGCKPTDDDKINVSVTQAL